MIASANSFVRKSLACSQNLQKAHLTSRSKETEMNGEMEVKISRIMQNLIKYKDR
jgi:hypothetical protein